MGVVAHEEGTAPAQSIPLEPTASSPPPELRARADDGVRALLTEASPEIVSEHEPRAERSTRS
jgi:hypothetical protein